MYKRVSKYSVTVTTVTQVAPDPVREADQTVGPLIIGYRTCRELSFRREQGKTMYYRQVTTTKDGTRCTGSVVPSTVRLILLVTAAICFMGSFGCRGEDTIWTAEESSPDGRWLASARTVETSGFGTGDIETDVYLKWTRSSKPAVAVLGFVHDPRSQSKTIDISMKWITPSHLDVTYAGHARVDFQVVKYGDVDISLRDLSSIQENNSQ
jgi:hypothetical protein